MSDPADSAVTNCLVLFSASFFSSDLFVGTAQDLSTYLAVPDLTKAGKKCGIIGVANEQKGLECFQQLGFTTPCALIWNFDVFELNFHFCLALTKCTCRLSLTLDCAGFLA